MLKKSIAYRLSIYISLAVISVFVAFIVIYFLFNQRFIKESVQNRAVALSGQVLSNVNMHVVTAREVASNISEQIIFYGQQDHADRFIKSLIDKYRFINAIHVNIDSTITTMDYHNYFCFRQNDSTFLFEGNKHYQTCTSETEPFKKLIKDKVPAWSEPMRCSRNQHVVVSYYNPIEIEDANGGKKWVGEVICELSLFELNESVNQIKIGENGFAFLISQTGHFITHPISEWILERNIFEVSPEIFDLKSLDAKQILAEGRTGTLVAYPDFINHKKSWVHYTPIAENGWMLLFVHPYSELFEPLYLPLLQMLFFSVLGILVIYLLVTYITNRQIQPLSSVTQQLKAFSSVTGDAAEISQNEIIQVAESLDSMRTWFDKYKLTRSQEAQKSESRKRDLDQASEIQQSLIKTDFPAFPGRNDIDLYACYHPAKVVSGDLFDFFFVDDEHLVFTIGDVSGKGIPAAIFMSVAQTIIKGNSNLKSAKGIVNTANKELYTNNQHQFFITLFLGILDLKTGKLTYCNAAHTFPYVLKGNGELLELGQSHGLPLGLYPDKKYQQAQIVLEKGDSVILYTDGVTEQQDDIDVQYGVKRLEQNLVTLAGQSPKDIVTKIEKSLELYRGSADQSDDISMLVIGINREN